MLKTAAPAQKGFFIIVAAALLLLVATLEIWNPNSLWHSEKKFFKSQVAKWTRKTMNNDTRVRTDPMDPGLQNELKRRLEVATTEKIEDNATSAVIFYVMQFDPKDFPRPEQRNPRQLHIFSTRESAKYVRNRFEEVRFQDDYEFNATMSYRRDSDIYASYQIFVLDQILTRRKKTPAEILKLKSKTSIAMISNCTPVMRMKIVRQIIRHGFAVDLVGGCFPNSLKLPKGDQKATEKLSKYKFYFAFENSYHCKDYITEKLYTNALKSLTVPVVFGATKKDYEAVIPKGSFIFVEDFSSVRELVNYLKYLDSNDTAYLQYFRWHDMKVSQTAQYGRQIRYCNLCRVLHGINIDDLYNPTYSTSGNPISPFTDGVAPRSVPSLKEYFLGEENKECLEPDETRLAIYSRFWGK